MSDDLRTPSEWEQRFRIRVLDPDGWRSDGKPWDAPISRSEWEHRILRSTIGPLPDGR